MIYTPVNLTTTSGTPKAFATSRTVANWILVTALGSNAGANVFVAGVDPITKKTNVSASGSVGIQIAKGTTVLIPSISAVPYIDLSQVFFDVVTSNDGISFTYGLR